MTNLATIFNFTPDDLRANRAGTLTPRQEELLENFLSGRQKSILRMFIVYLVGFSLLIFISLLAPVALGNRELDSLIAKDLPIFVLVITTLCGIITFDWILDRWLMRDVTNKKMRKAEGIASVKSRVIPGGAEPYTDYYLFLGQTRFHFSYPGQAQAFEDGQHYRIYYVKNYPVPFILSVERL